MCVYVYVYKREDAKIYTTIKTFLRLFFSLCLSLGFCPFFLPQASVSMKRLRVFLSHEELQTDSVERRPTVGCESLTHT